MHSQDRRRTRKREELFEEIERYENELKTIKEILSNTPKHITWKELKEEDRFEQLLPGKKRLIDTVSMIADRAETTMATLLTTATVDFPLERQLLQTLFVTEADILPDKAKKQLRILVHSMPIRLSPKTLDRGHVYSCYTPQSVL